MKPNREIFPCLARTTSDKWQVTSGQSLRFCEVARSLLATKLGAVVSVNLCVTRRLAETARGVLPPLIYEQVQLKSRKSMLQEIVN